MTQAPRPPFGELARYFLGLGTTGFGGPVVLCGLMERDLVERRRWISAVEMRDIIAVCQSLPGPLAVQVAIFIGYLRLGTIGAWIAGWALILPASVMVGVLAAMYVALHGLPWLDAALYGVNPAVIALIAASWWRLVRSGITDRFQIILGAGCTFATLAFPGLITATFLGAGLLGIAWYVFGPGRPARLLDLSPLLVLAHLAWFFLLSGTLTFGGGLAVVPLLEEGLVRQGQWLSAPDFLIAIAVGMITPGPVMTAATFAGYLVAGPIGAAVCTIAIYLPSFLLVPYLAPRLMRQRDKPAVRGFLNAVYAAAMGAILGGTLLLASRAVGDGVSAVIAGVGLVAVMRFHVPGPVIVGVAALARLLLFPSAP